MAVGRQSQPNARNKKTEQRDTRVWPFSTCRLFLHLEKLYSLNGFYNIINGEKVSAGKALSVVNPSTGKRLASVPDIDRALLDQAVNAAQKAFSGWREVLLSQRKVILTSLLNRIDGHAEELSALLTAEQGDALAGAWAQSRRIAFPRCPIRG
jgi:delta 1-pyrroline-5-carboxylate dehydrogenase